MYLLTPILSAIISLGGIIIIVWRKRTYIKKIIAVEVSAQNGLTSLSNSDFFSKLFNEMFPEIVLFFKNIKFYEYKESWLMEAEKFLRRLRLLSLRMDRLSNTLIHKVRRGHLNGSKLVVTTEELKISETTITPIIKTDNEVEGEALKKEEQKLIIEIAKSPKNSQLYAQLGDLYVKMGGFSDAKESFEAAMELDPANEELKKKHSTTLEKLNYQS